MIRDPGINQGSPLFLSEFNAGIVGGIRAAP